MVVGLLIFAASCGKESRVTTIRLSLILGDSSEWYAGAAKWKELVEERTGGKMVVKIFPHASLSSGKQRTELEMVQAGTLQASLESTILLSLVDRRFSVFSMPWLFPDHETANKVCDGPAGQKMLDLLPEKMLVGLAYGVNGFRQITNNRGPIEKLEDLKALKIRVPAIKMYIDLFHLFGADPSDMNFGELVQALEQGTMDAQENPLSVIWAAKLFKVQKYVTCWNYSYDPIVLCLNKKFWDGLAPDVQKVLRECAKEAFDYERQLVAENDRVLVEKLKAEGMQVTVPSAEQLEPLQQVQEKLYEQYGSEIGADLIDTFRNAVKQCAAADEKPE